MICSRCQADPCACPDGITLYLGDSAQVVPAFAADSFSALVTDPPAGISFMGREWDSDRGGRRQWTAWLQGILEECLRVMKSGAYGFVWALPRTSHWTGTAIEDAGFEVRDRIIHCFGSGFPKSLDVSKAIDKAKGAERQVVGSKLDRPGYSLHEGKGNGCYGGGNGLHAPGTDARLRAAQITAPATPEAARWAGWGTALKPAFEDWWLIRKPLSERTVAANVQRWGVGALNVDGCKIGKFMGRMGNGLPTRIGELICGAQGRWPANLIHDGSDEVMGLFPLTGPTPGSYDSVPRKQVNCYGKHSKDSTYRNGHADNGGSAARFFYCAKASASDRGDKSGQVLPLFDESIPEFRNTHPTVKPLALMRYLLTMICPPGSLVLDPFAGSGTTLVACKELGLRAVGIELDETSCKIAAARLERTHANSN